MAQCKRFKHKCKYKNALVIASTTIQKGKTFQVQTDFELMNNIIGLADDLKQSHQKVIRDILGDFFLDQKLKRQEFELSDI
jgi:hypothetical protein